VFNLYSGILGVCLCDPWLSIGVNLILYRGPNMWPQAIPALVTVRAGARPAPSACLPEPGSFGRSDRIIK
jgi:hypothetical protein